MGHLESAPWAPGTVILQDYVVESLLGQGGMGTVHLVSSRGGSARFAVKRIRADRIGTARRRRALLRELLVWSELPEHPHLAAFRFFRSLGEEVLLFSEYIQGGSLADGLRKRPPWPRVEALDVAIQMAWALECAHQWQVAHLDMKPGNVLLGIDGAARLTDFGLAQAAEGGPEGSWESSGTTWAGTPGFRSPEQALRRSPGIPSDIWSWGLTLLAMLAGGVTWRFGEIAPEVLEFLLDGEELRSVSPSVMEMLAGCFRLDPAARWGSFERPVEILEQEYQAAAGTSYPRSRPPVPPPPSGPARRRSRYVGIAWEDPIPLLQEALRAAGGERGEAPASPPARTTRSQAIADLILLDDARRIYQALVEWGEAELTEPLARLLRLAGLLHTEVGDFPGGSGLYDRAIRLYESLREQEDGPAVASGLANCLMDKATLLWRSGRSREASVLYPRAIALHRRLVGDEEEETHRRNLARACMNQGIVLWSLGELVAAGRFLDESTLIWEELSAGGASPRYLGDLARTAVNRGNVHLARGELREATERYRLAVDAYQRLAGARPEKSLDSEQALAHMSLANAQLMGGMAREAREQYDRAIAIYQRLVHEDGRVGLLDELALMQMNAASAAQALGELDEALDLLERAMRLYRRLVEQEGRKGLEGKLALAGFNRGRILELAGRYEDALRLYQECQELLERRPPPELPPEEVSLWASAVLGGEVCRRRLGRTSLPAARIREAFATLEEQAEARADFRQVLESLRQELG